MFTYNIGSYIILSIIFLYFILLIIFVAKGYILFLRKINRLINHAKKLKVNINKNINIKKTDKSNPPKIIKRKIKNKSVVKSFLNTNDSKNKSLNLINISNIQQYIDIPLNNGNIKENKEIKKKKNMNKEKNKNTKKDINFNYNLNDYELNSLDYKEALKIDKRTYFQY